MARKPVSGPAADPEVLILSSLASGPKHGYAIMSDIATAMGTALGPGTLYTAITRLVEQKLIAPDPISGRQRPYRLTAQGASVLQTRLHDMQRVAALALRRLRTA
jgi:DNA-binding PadR family transcriptional regulator